MSINDFDKTVNDMEVALSGIDKSEQDSALKGANLVGADLRGADLVTANLEGANLAHLDQDALDAIREKLVERGMLNK